MPSNTKCLIIGSGPAGYTAAIYASRANLHPLLYEGNEPGGQLTITTEVENFPGYPDGVQGPEMMMDMRRQAERVGAEIRPGFIRSIDLSTRPFRAEASDGSLIDAQTVIVATGAQARFLGLPDEQKFMGYGVSACATCDGFFYRGRRVAVVGGGDTACEEALYLAGIAAEVFMIVRKDHLRASKAMQRRVFDKANIKVLFNTNTLGLYGDGSGDDELLQGAHLVEHKGTPAERTYDLPLDGFFLAIGRQPNTALIAGQLHLDDSGYIKTATPSTATNVPGVFAAGDVADPHYQQAIVAAASGCRAALDAEDFLMMQQ